MIYLNRPSETRNKEQTMELRKMRPRWYNQVLLEMVCKQNQPFCPLQSAGPHMISKQALGMEGMENQEYTRADEKTSFSSVSM